jgi:hypothetical protein
MSTDKILVKVSQNAQVKLSEDQTIVKKIVLGPPVKRVTAAKFDASTLNGDSAAYYLDYNNFTNTPTILDSDMIKSFTLDSSEVLALIDSDYFDLIGLQNVLDSGSGVTLLGNVKINDHVLPSANQQYDLGSPTNKFRALYIAGRTVYLGNLAMSDSGGTLTLASLDSSGEVIPGTSQAVLTSAVDSADIVAIVDSDYVTSRVNIATLTQTGLVWDRDGNTATAAQYRDSDEEVYTIRNTAISSGILNLTLASFTPTISASGQSLNWDVPATSFSVSVTNPDDFDTRYIASVGSITETGGDVHETLSDFTTSGPSTTPAGGVDWTQTFSTGGSSYIRSTSTTITGGSASASLTFLEDDSSTYGTASFTTNWATPNVSISMSNLSGNTFLDPYESTSYSVSVTGFSNSSNYSTTVTPTGGTVSNSSGSGTFTFTTALHQDNTGGRTLAVSTDMTRPSGVTGTEYAVTDTASDTSLSSTWTYPSMWIFTSSTSTAPTSGDIVDGTGFTGDVNQLSNQTKTFGATVNNSEATPQAFWFGVRTSASQPTTFQTGASSSLLSDVSTTTATVTLSNTYTSESYSFYGITLQPGNTYVSIS